VYGSECWAVGPLYRELASYDFHQSGECWPSEQTLADRLEVHRKKVCRGIALLRRLGWVTVTKHRGQRWDHNVYVLHEPYNVSDLAARRITKQAHAKNPLEPKRLISGHTICVCRLCTSKTRRQNRHVLTPSEQMAAHLYGRKRRRRSSRLRDPDFEGFMDRIDRMLFQLRRS
jgi:hypothetical protein